MLRVITCQGHHLVSCGARALGWAGSQESGIVICLLLGYASKLDSGRRSDDGY